MQTKLPILLFALAAGSAAMAAPLTSTTAVHTKPDVSATTITVLKAGTEPAVAHDALATSPAGWLPVTLPGPFEGYVLNKDVMKSLDIRVGAPVFLTPKPDAGVITELEADDKAEITGLHGKWTQIRVEKTIVGFIHLGSAAGATSPVTAAPVSSPAPAGVATPKSAPAPSPAPVTPTAYGSAQAGQPAPVVAVNNPGAPSLPRLFQGKFVSTRSPFRPRRPYDWAVNDDAGSRYAYLDISKLLLTDQIENYVNRVVVVYGAAKAVPDSKDIVIQVESLQLK